MQSHSIEFCALYEFHNFDSLDWQPIVLMFQILHLKSDFRSTQFPLTLMLSLVFLYLLASYKHIYVQVLFNRGDVHMPISELPGFVI